MKSIKLNSNKAISPVVAVALLLVVAAISVIGFQTWFNDFSSQIYTNVEENEINSLNTEIENLIGYDLYFKNGDNENITITQVKIDGIDCNIAGTYSEGISEIDLGVCLENLTNKNPEVVVYTIDKIYSKKIYLKEIVQRPSCTLNGTTITHGNNYSFYNSSTVSFGNTCSFESRTCHDGVLNGTSSYNISNCIVLPLNCSILGLSGGTWITVPGNSVLGTNDFCVMKYEAKDVGGIATSQVALTPWVSISQTNARTECTDLGSKYHLITNAEWTTIGRNIEALAQNWNSSIVGTGFIYTGHNDGNPGSILNSTTNDSDYYYRTNDNSSACDGSYTNYAAGNDTIFGQACLGQKRVLTLNNSEVIWDMSGNAWELNNETCNTASWASNAWIEWTNVVLSDGEKTTAGPIGAYLPSNGVGKYNGCSVDGRAFRRSSNYLGGEGTGIFTLDFSASPSSTAGDMGFRCTYTP